MSSYYTVVTDYGLECLQNCIASGEAFGAAYIAIGDGNGSSYEPSSTQTALKNTKYKAKLSSKGKRDNYLYFQLQIPLTESGYTMREAGLLDEDENLLAIAKYPETPLNGTDSGLEENVYIEIQLYLSDDAINQITIDSSGNLITEDELAEYQPLSEKGEVGGYASLDENGKVPDDQLPETDSGADVNLSNLTATGKSQYNAFSVNTGDVDDDGNPVFITYYGGTNSTMASTVTLSDLTDFQAITDGSAVISMNNETYTISGLDFSTAEDFSDVASILQTAIQANTDGGELWTNSTVTYVETETTTEEETDEETTTSGSFILTAGLVGAYAIGYASTAEETTTDEETEEETTSVIGTDISSLIGWSEADEPAITTGEPPTLTTSGAFSCTIADGTIYEVTDTLSLDISDYEDGKYNIFVDPVGKSISLAQGSITTGVTFPSSAVSGDYLLNIAQVPYDFQQITITTETDEEGTETTTSTVTKGLNLVLAGTLTISSGEVSLKLNAYNSNVVINETLTDYADINLSNLSDKGKTVIDGQWVDSYLQIVTSSLSSGTHTYDLRGNSYLPDDDYDYEVLMSSMFYSTTSTSPVIDVYTDIITTSMEIGRVNTDGQRMSQTFIVPVYQYLTLVSSYGCTANIYINGYRRLGTNN